MKDFQQKDDVQPPLRIAGLLGQHAQSIAHTYIYLMASASAAGPSTLRMEAFGIQWIY